jgi:hypothetical protein
MTVAGSKEKNYRVGITSARTEEIDMELDEFRMRLQVREGHHHHSREKGAAFQQACPCQP